MNELKQQIKELVAYILSPKERDEAVIESYTDTILDVCEEYHQSKLKNNGDLGDVSGSFIEEVKKLLLEYRDGEMPDWNSPYHYEAEGWSSMKYFMKWLDKKSNDR